MAVSLEAVTTKMLMISSIRHPASPKQRRQKVELEESEIYTVFIFSLAPPQETSASAAGGLFGDDDDDDGDGDLFTDPAPTPAKPKAEPAKKKVPVHKKSCEKFYNNY